MGVGYSFGEAFIKSQLGAGVKLPQGGRAFISVRDSDKLAAVEVARELTELGFTLLATRGTAAVLDDARTGLQPLVNLYSVTPCKPPSGAGRSGGRDIGTSIGRVFRAMGVEVSGVSRTGRGDPSVAGRRDGPGLPSAGAAPA
jgi:hypothetical protein